MRTLLVIAGTLSGYSFELYRAVAKDWPCTVHLVYEPRPESTSYAHERDSVEDLHSLDWTRATNRELARFVRACQPNAVIIHGSKPAKAIGVVLAILPKSIPALFVSDANIYDLVSQWGKLLSRMAAYAVLFARVQTALSWGLSNELALRLLGAPSIRRLPAFAIDYAVFDRARDLAPIQRSPRTKRIVIVARLDKVKNQGAAIEAVSSDPALRDGVTLSFVGDGPLRSDLEALARRGQVRAEFLGAVPRAQVGAALAHADALLLPSTHEPWGIVVCEALGMGIPVIATPAVGAAVSLAGHSGGIVVSNSPSAPDLADSIRDFIARADELTAAARSSAPQIRQQYSLPDVTRRLVALLQELTAGTGEPCI